MTIAGAASFREDTPIDTRGAGVVAQVRRHPAWSRDYSPAPRSPRSHACLVHCLLAGPEWSRRPASCPSRRRTSDGRPANVRARPPRPSRGAPTRQARPCLAATDTGLTRSWLRPLLCVLAMKVWQRRTKQVSSHWSTDRGVPASGSPGQGRAGAGVHCHRRCRDKDRGKRQCVSLSFG